jgi:hypothetical protein
LALRSRLPNEVEWAIFEMIPYSKPGNLIPFDQIPDLLTEILYQGFTALRIFRICEKAGNDFEYELELVKLLSHEAGPNAATITKDKDDHGWAHRELAKRKRMLSSVLLILHNCSFSFPNAKRFSTDPRFFAFLAETIKLAKNAFFMECHRYVLVIIENIAVQTNLFNMQPLFQYVVSFHNSPDLFFLGSCYATLAKSMIMPNELDAPSMLQGPVLDTALSLLLVRDDKTLMIVTEFWSQFIDFVLKSQTDFPLKLETLVSNLLTVCMARSFRVQDKDMYDIGAW